MGRQVKRAFKFRFHPTETQAEELSRTFGCVRLVYNRMLAERTRAYISEGRRVSYAESSALLTRWKRTEELAFLGEVSCVPLQQALRHLQSAFVNFWAKRAGYPAFKSRKKSRASAEYTRSAFTYRDGRLTKAQRNLSRKTKSSANRRKDRLSVARAHARITDRRTDFLHKLTTRLVRENQRS